MKVIIKNKEVRIDDNRKKIADKLADVILDNCKESLLLKKQPSLYFATIIMLHTKTGDILNCIDPEILEQVFKQNEVKDLKVANE